jgi:hypothetical protein
MLLNKDTPRRIKQRQDCRTVSEIKDFIKQYFDIYERYENRQFGHQSNFTLVYKDKPKGNNHTDISIKLIWYNDEELVTEVKLDWYRGWRDEDREYKNYDWTFKNEDYNDECWFLWNDQGRRDIVENCDILTEIMNFIIKYEVNLPSALLREKKLKQLLGL